MTKPLVLFDGNCGFCKIWVEYSKALAAERLDFEPSPERAPTSVQLALPDGSVLSGALAVFTILQLSGKSWPVWLYKHLPGFEPLSEAVYRWIAAHRNFSYRVTIFTFGKDVQPAQFSLSTWAFLRTLGLIYFFAFLSLAVQVRGLIGSNGILPAARYLAAVSEAIGVSGYWRMPTVFWLNTSDVMLSGVCYLGAVLGLAAFFGLSWRVLLAALYVLYLSVATVGQDFLSFQWDALLLEAGFLAIFLRGSRTVVYLYRWLLFRLLFLSGCVKLLSHDLSWRHLTALDYHYFTQPLPTPFAWYLALLSQWFQHASTAFVFLAELGAPFLIFAPRRLRHPGAIMMILLQILIVVSGNYAYFNLLTLALCLFLFDDRSLARIHGLWRFSKPLNSDSRILRRANAALAAIVLVLSATQLIETFTHVSPPILSSIQNAAAPLQIVNSYGLFAVMTTVRNEIDIQGSNDGQQWTSYEFRYKPEDLNRAPQWIAPHQPRLDWQMWFAALGNYQSNPWFVALLHRLLEGSPDVEALFRSNPFPGVPPRYVRAVFYDYRFTDWGTRTKTGNWWTRTPRGYYLPPISLESFRKTE